MIKPLPVFLSSLHVSLSAQGQTMVSALVFSTLLWLSLILALRFCLKLLLSYHRWVFEAHGRVSNTTKVWGVSCVAAPSCGCCVEAVECCLCSSVLISGCHFV